MQQVQHIIDYLESGKGLVVLHHAVVSYQDWGWWWREVMGASYVQRESQDESGANHTMVEQIEEASKSTHPELDQEKLVKMV